MGCSLGAGRGDRLSDIDAGVACAESLGAEDLDAGDLAMLDEQPPNLIEDRLRREVREWVMLAWWAVSDVAKYLQRGSLFEAADRITSIREWALRLFAAANQIPDAGYGLTSLLDHEPYALPANLADTYCLPDDPAAVANAAPAVVTPARLCRSGTNHDFCRLVDTLVGYRGETSRRSRSQRTMTSGIGTTRACVRCCSYLRKEEKGDT